MLTFQTLLDLLFGCILVALAVTLLPKIGVFAVVAFSIAGIKIALSAVLR